MPCRTSCRGAALAERKGAESWFYRLQHWDVPRGKLCVCQWSGFQGIVPIINLAGAIEGPPIA